MPTQKAMLVDVKRCIGCLSCETACKQLHGFGTDPEPTLSETAFTVVESRGDKFVRKLCMHCEDPACASACPVGAISKLPLGPVVYNADKCIGCRYCMIACPYSVPRYQWSKLAPFVKKCDLCAERVKIGGSRRALRLVRLRPASSAIAMRSSTKPGAVFAEIPRTCLTSTVWKRPEAAPCCSSPMCRSSGWE